MRFLSLFSGIEAASCAWLPLGWQCAAVGEIEPFPCAGLKHHYPELPNLGDVTKITQEQIAELGHIDLVVGGFPCQDLSVAGKRAGLRNDDGTATRSGLFFGAMRIAEWSGARFILVENVPGLFSSNRGKDFAAVVGEMAGCEFDVPRDGWRNAGVVVGPRGLVEWTVLDAQYHRLAQRRRRVFIVRDSGDWRSRPPIFLEQYRLQGNPPPRRESGKNIAPTISARTKGGGGLGTDFDCDGGLIPSIVGQAMSAKWAKGTAGPAGPAGDECHNLIPVPIAFDCKASGQSGFGVGEIAATMRSMGHSGSHQNGGGHQAVAFAQNQRDEVRTMDVAGALAGEPGMKQQTYIAFDLRGREGGAMPEMNDTAAMRAASGGSSRSYVAAPMMVRRLTPRECERLQGFSDDYTLIQVRNKPAADGPRYKALGNSMAVPCMRWIGERIQSAAQPF